MEIYNETINAHLLLIQIHISLQKTIIHVLLHRYSKFKQINAK